MKCWCDLKMSANQWCSLQEFPVQRRRQRSFGGIDCFSAPESWTTSTWLDGCIIYLEFDYLTAWYLKCTDPLARFCRVKICQNFSSTSNANMFYFITAIFSWFECKMKCFAKYYKEYTKYQLNSGFSLSMQSAINCCLREKHRDTEAIAINFETEIIYQEPVL